MANPIQYWDRKEQKQKTEQVYGDLGVKLLWGGKFRASMTESFLGGSWFSSLIGGFQSSRASKKRIPKFISQYKIPMTEYEDPGFQSFNDFFIRKFRPGVRKFETEAGRMPAPCEARYLAFESVKSVDRFPVKGQYLSPLEIIGEPSRARPFEEGPLLIARLCPVDYHRFHFPDDGKFLSYKKIPGKLISVNPAALRSRPKVFMKNYREVSVLETDHFGKLAYVEVGALCVGRVVQSSPTLGSFKRGEEKGYFLFGGSTVIVFGEKGAWTPDPDMIQKTREQVECFVRLGEAIASAK